MSHGKNLRTHPPAVITSSWSVVLLNNPGRTLLIIRNTGANPVDISTNDPEYVDGAGVLQPSPREPLNFFTLPAGEALSFEHNTAPMVLRAVSALGSTLHMIGG